MRKLTIFQQTRLTFSAVGEEFCGDRRTCAHGANALTLAASHGLSGWCDLSRICGSHVHNMAFLSASVHKAEKDGS